MQQNEIYKIENDVLEVTINSKGAEIVSVKSKETGKEYIWQGKEGYWSRHNPILFPHVGKTTNNIILIDGEEYPTSQHGFARDNEFKLVDQAEGSISFALEQTEETLKRFPYKFKFIIKYELYLNRLKTIWEVHNTDNKTIAFGIGAHPAFSTPPSKSDYYLYFPEKQELTYKLLNTETGCAVDKEYRLKLEDSRVRLSNSMFEKDALIFDNTQITDCILQDDQLNNVVQLITDYFPFYGIWSDGDAPFVCLEPWLSRTDDEGFDGEFYQKPGVTTLETGESFTKDYTINFFV